MMEQNQFQMNLQQQAGFSAKETFGDQLGGLLTDIGSSLGFTSKAPEPQPDPNGGWKEQEQFLTLGGNSPQVTVKKKDPRNRHFDHNGPWSERKNGAIYAGGTKAFSNDEVKRCIKIFEMYDVDGSGGIDYPEFCVLYTVLKFPQKFTDQESVKFFEKFDIDRDGMLNEDEFLRLVTRELCRKTT